MQYKMLANLLELLSLLDVASDQFQYQKDLKTSMQTKLKQANILKNG